MTRAAISAIVVMQIIIGSIMYIYSKDEIQNELKVLRENAEVIENYKKEK